MAMVLRQSTAVDVLIGPFVDLTDGATAQTGESPAVKLSKNGQALATKSDVTTPVHDADGYYNCEFDATDTNTVGTLVLTVAASGTALPVRHEFQVVEEAVYDRDYASSATGAVSVASGGITSSSFASNSITAAATAADFIAEINAEVDTALADFAAGTLTLPGQASPSNTPTRDFALSLLYFLARNMRDHSATGFRVYANDDTTVNMKSTFSDSGTIATRGKLVSGP